MTKRIVSIGLIISALIICLTGCASWKRGWKSFTSDVGNGLERTVTVYSYDGDVLGQWSGKFDVAETSTETYFDLDGKRVIIQGGIIINEEN